MDLSRTIQLSGLSPGAKLTLVQASRSAAPVSVALQLPQSASSTPNTRLVDKFPSTTTLWQILRRFESGVAGGASTSAKNFNFTQRATPLMANGRNVSGEEVSGAGRLCYEMPTLNIMGRQLESISDLSRTLQQLGMSGNVMMRLSFKNTMQPLEEAMAEITRYFDDVTERPAVKSEQDPNADILSETSADAMDTARDSSQLQAVTPDQREVVGPQVLTSKSTELPDPESTTASLSPSIRNISVFSPPSNSVPAAAVSNATHNDADYIPTADHARSHQANLARASRNKRLLTDAEIEKQRRERDTQLAQVNYVIVRLRFPDQSSVQKEYGQLDTLSTLYDTCRAVMDRSNSEPFDLHATGATGGAVQGSGTSTVAALPESDEKLIRDLGWTGRVLVTVGWSDEVSKARRTQPSLKSEFRARAEEMKVSHPIEEPGKSSGSAVPGVSGIGGQATPEDSKEKKAGDKEAKLKKLLGFKK